MARSGIARARLRSVLSPLALAVSLPVSGLVVSLILGPISSVGPAFAGGVLAGLGIGAAEALALDRPLARWTLATALGLGAGSAAAIAVGDLLPRGPVAVLSAAVVAGALTATAQAFAGPPTPRGMWIGVTTAAWTAGWAVSLALAIDADQGYIVFGASGAIVFTLAVLLAARVGGRGVGGGAS